MSKLWIQSKSSNVLCNAVLTFSTMSSFIYTGVLMINMYTSYTNSIFAQVTRGTVFQNCTAEEWKYYYLCFQSAQLRYRMPLANLACSLISPLNVSSYNIHFISSFLLLLLSLSLCLFVSHSFSFLYFLHFTLSPLHSWLCQIASFLWISVPYISW
jgi:hypothetical protein